MFPTTLDYHTHMGHTYLNKRVKRDLRELVPPDTELNSSHEYSVQCPLCMKELNEFGKTLYITEDFGTGFCHRCGSVFSSSTKKKISIKDRAPKVYPLTTIDCSYYKNSREEQQSGIDYLIGRDSWFKDHYKELGIRFRDDRVVIPFFDYNRNIYFYQSRFIDPNAKPKYHTPPTSNKPFYYCPISNLSSKKVMLCEGVFGAIAAARRFPDYKVLAVLGSYVTNYQRFTLSREEVKEFVLYFDHLDIDYAIRDKLEETYPHTPIKFIISPLGDPEDDLKAGKDLEIKTALDIDYATEMNRQLMKALGV